MPRRGGRLSLGATTCGVGASFPSRYHSAGIIIRQARRPTFRLSSPSIQDIIQADAVNILFQATRLVPQRRGIKMMYRRPNEFYKSADWRASTSRCRSYFTHRSRSHVRKNSRRDQTRAKITSGVFDDGSFRRLWKSFVFSLSPPFVTCFSIFSQESYIFILYKMYKIIFLWRGCG